jgi:prevent-host-death family protein
MLKTVSVSDLRAKIRHILNEVGYGQSDYVIEKFGEPAAVIIRIEDFRLLQEIKQERASISKDRSFLRELEEIHQALQASGYRPRTKDEIDRQVQIERDSWGT